MRYKFPKPSSKLTFADGDLFDRSKFAEYVTNIIKNNASESLVISLEAPWGEGKTSFLYKWKNQLEASHAIKSIYVDSYSHDFHNDALTVLAYVIDQELQKSDLDSGIKNKLSKKFGQLVSALTIGTAKAATKVMIQKALGDKAPDEFINAIKSELEGTIGKQNQSIFDDLKKRKDLINDLKDMLKKIKSYITDSGRPLVIFIDELDRCKPTFAIEIIEAVKHLFDTDGFIFVLAYNPKQLNETVKVVYGADVEARSYLSKLFDIQLILPTDTEEIKKESESSEADASRFVEESLTYLLETKPIDIEVLDKYVGYMPDMRMRLNLSLRDLEKLCLHLMIFEETGFKSDLIKNMKPSEKLFLDENLHLIILSTATLLLIQPELVHHLKDSKLTWEELKRAFRYSDKKSEAYDEDIYELWQIYLSPDKGQVDVYAKFYKGLPPADISRLLKVLFTRIARHFVNIRISNQG